jgi:hypothetical protein
MKNLRIVSLLLVRASAACLSGQAQVLTLSRQEMLKFTAANPFDRFPDGRPRVSDSLLEKMGSSPKSVIAAKGVWT